MVAESNVGARLFLIGKAGVLAGLKEIQGAVATLNRQIAAGAASSKAAATASDAQSAALARQNLILDTYKANLAEATVASDALARVGKVAFYTIGAAAAAWGYESVKWAQQYQTALVQLRTQAGLTASAISQIGRAAMGNAASLGISPTAYLQAAYHPASAGFGRYTVREAIAITNAAAKLSAVGSSPVETTVNALTSVIKSYNLPKRSVLPTVAMLNAIIGAGNMHAATLNAALASGVAATANTFGVSLASLGGALAFMTDRGVPASQAGTHLRMTLALLGAPSKQAQTILSAAGMSTTTIQSSQNALAQLLQESGVTSTQLSRALRTNKGKGGIYNALHLLKMHLDAAHLTKQMQAALISRSFGGGRMGSTVMMMFNSVTSLGSKSTKIRRTGSASRFMEDWKKEQHTFDFQLHRFGAEIETLGTAFGKKLLPPLTKVLEVMTSFMKFLDKHKAIVYGLATAISAVLVPAIGLYLYRALLSSGGAIRTVLTGYANLIRGNNVEQIALKKTSAQLQMTTAETDALAAADTRLSVAASRAALTERSLAGASGTPAATATVAGTSRFAGVGSKLLRSAGIAGAAWMAGTLISNGQGSTVHRGQTLAQGLESEGGDIVKGAGLGAAIGSIFPGPGTAVGAGVGAVAGAAWGVRHTIAHDASSVWDDLFGGGHPSTPTKPQRLQLRVDNHVYIDGKEVTKVVRTRTRKKASLTG